MNYELKTCIKQNTKKKERKRRENTLKTFPNMFTKGKDNCLFYNYFTKFEDYKNLLLYQINFSIVN